MGLKEDKKRLSTKKHVSTAEYQQLLGLVLLANTHVEALRCIEQAILDLTQELDYEGNTAEVYSGSHCGDTAQGANTADELLDKLDLKVKK